MITYITILKNYHCLCPRTQWQSIHIWQ